MADPATLLVVGGTSGIGLEIARYYADDQNTAHGSYVSLLSWPPVAAGAAISRR